MSLPDRYLVSGSRTKCLLRDAYADRLPNEVIRGAKRGFEVPMRRWLSNELRPMLFDLLDRPSSYVRNWIDGRFIDEMLNNPTNTGMNWDAFTYSLLVLELWFEQQAADNGQIGSPESIAPERVDVVPNPLPRVA